MYLSDITYSTAIENVLSGNSVLSSLIEDGSEAYPHTTCRIHTLSEYIFVVSAIDQAIKKERGYCLDQYSIFRGTADSGYDLRPSLFRLSGYNQRTEGDLVNGFAALRPEAFENCGNHFELLAKMQHYGLPTRLLDFSLNPLVALYFSCEDQAETDGRVVCHNTNMSLDDSEVVEAVCGMYQFHMIDENEPAEEYLRNSSLSIVGYLNRVYLGTPLTLRPKYWNQRIRNQSAVFMVFPNLLVDHLSGAAIQIYNGWPYDHCTGVKPDEETRRRVQRIIEAEKPQNIFRNAPPCVMTSQEWSAIKKCYETTVEGAPVRLALFDENTCVDNLYDRFHFVCDYCKVEKDALKDRFFSMIIDAGSKKRILHELESIGIDIAFIYPELEYTARKLAQKYR